MKLKKILISILAGAFVFALGAGIYDTKKVSAESTPTYWTGFEITGTAVRTAEPAGLRFKTDVARLTPTMKKYNPDAEYYTTLTFTTSGGQSYTKTRTVDVWRSDGSGWNTVLLEIPESDYQTQVTAQSFIKLNGKEQAFYQTKPVTISIAQTAAAAISYGAEEMYVGKYIENVVTGVTLNKATVSMEIGQTVSLLATTTPSGYKAKYTSDNESVAVVDVNGNVKGKGIGAATIAAEINGHKATCQVTVNARTETLTGFANSATIKNSNKSFTISSSWLDTLFADERIEAGSFDATAEKAMNLTALGGNYTIALPAKTAKMITITRSMYEVWKTLGETNLTLISDCSDFGFLNLGSVTITFDNFKKVWAEEESEKLTQAEVAALEGYIPDYQYNSARFDFFGYSSMSNGTWTQYDENGNASYYESEEDYRNVYRVEEYKEAGMTILFPQSIADIPRSAVNNFDFANSKIKQVMDMALEAGIQKVILADKRLYALCENETDTIIGEGKAFATEADLDAVVKKYMKDYAAHPAFYGVQLLDEPKYPVLKAQGDVYRSIKRCYPNAYVQCNLHPSVGNGIGNKYPPVDDHQDLVAAYKAKGYNDYYSERFAAYELYLTNFLDYTGADYIMYDHYPIREGGFYESYIGGMQVAANVCAARGVKFHFVSQTMTMQESADGTYEYCLNEADLRWLNNMQLGFGAKQLAYFTYFTRDNMQSQTFLDGGSFINRDGTKTNIYYMMREILAENQAFASTILSFDYKTSAAYIANGYAHSVTNAQSCIQGDFAKVQSVFVNTESALISELQDKLYNKYMYMVQNITQPQHQTAGTLQTVKLTFNENYEYAIVWKNGERSIVRLTNNTYVVKQNSGEAVYVIPFNAKEDDGYVYDPGTCDNGAWFPESDRGTSPW